MTKQLKLFIAFIFALFSTSIAAVEPLQKLCTQQVAREFVSDAMLDQFKNNPHFIQEKRLNYELQDIIKDTILASYRPTVDALRLNDWILSISTITPAITLTGHNGSVCSVTWSPDGNRIATASFDDTTKIWDAQNGALLNTLTGHNGSVESVAWSPDGNHVATALEDRTAKIWNLPQLQKLSLEQTLFLALVYHDHQTNQPLTLDTHHEHLHTIFNTLSADIQNTIRNRIIIEETQQVEEIQSEASTVERGWLWGGLVAGAAVASFMIYKWLRK